MTLYVLLGPTAVGKTELALQMAEKLGSPILNCDSRQIYRGMEIGTAAPTKEQMQRVRHYFVGTHDIGSYYSAAQYEQDVLSLVKELSEEHQSLVLDRVRGAVVIDTPRTCGGFAPAGRIDAGLLCAKIEDAPATVWVNSLDGASIARSKRLLLTHITDVQGEGTKFTDDQMRTTLKWGHRPLVKNGKAKITLALDDPDAFAVYGIATNGKRTGKVESFSRDGRLCFIADVATPEGARILYEILRESKSALDS